MIAFLIVAFALFMVIKGMNYLRRKQEEAPALPSEEVKLLKEIRDALVKGGWTGKTAANPATQNLRHGKDFSRWGTSAMGTLRSRL